MKIENQESSNEKDERCIFFSDTYQRMLREIAQIQGDRFEHILQNYKEIFLIHFDKVVINNNITNMNDKYDKLKIVEMPNIEKIMENLGVPNSVTRILKQKNEHSNQFNDEIAASGINNSANRSEHVTNVNDMLEYINQDILTKENMVEIAGFGKDIIKDTFDKIINVYSLWLNTNITGATRELETLLVEHNMLEQVYNAVDLGEIPLYRARLAEQQLTETDFYHIPYNKRYLLKNQRFSLTGHPLLYLGLSPLCLSLELDYDNCVKISDLKEEDKDNIFKMTTFIMKSDEPIDNIFRLTNPFEDNSIAVSLKPGENKEIEDSGFLIQKENSHGEEGNIRRSRLITLLVKFILYNCCSFSVQHMQGVGDGKKKKPEFVEEYILPQLLAQTLKQKEYAGILYNSTKEFERRSVYPRFLYNIALFTTFNSNNDSKNSVYDEQLLNKFIKLSPIKYQDSKMVKKYNITIDKLRNMIKYLMQSSKNENINISLLLRINKDFEQAKKYEEYWETSIGQLHILCIYNILSYIQKTIEEG